MKLVKRATEKDIVKPHRWGPSLRIGLLLVIAVYATGLSRGITRPWTGMHDWNGAFFSQQARNLLRYPANIHHGMGVMAMGEEIPSPQERSLYARHPPALVWLLAAAFAIGGEREWVARLLPIAASLGTLVLLVRLLHRRYGTEVAIAAGLIYALMPMTVYFGRMVNHETLCLFLMLATLDVWHVRAALSGAKGYWLTGLCSVLLAAMIWIDWAGVLFAALFCVWVVWQWRRRRIGLAPVLVIGSTVSIATMGMLAYLVYAGFEGRWGDMVAMFNARRTTTAKDQARLVWTHIIENLTWPVFVVLVAGSCISMGRQFRSERTPQNRRRAGVEGPAAVGLGVVAITGLLWVTVFWRQFVIHNYWMYYLGPFIATMAAVALITFFGVLRTVSERLAGGVTVAIIAVVAAFCLIGHRDYFSRVTFPEGLIHACREVHRRTKPGDRVLLFRQPITIERHGQYQFRNITMPQHAYYMDRAFDVERNAATVVRRTSEYPLYIVPNNNPDYPQARPVVEALRHQFKFEVVGSEILFDLRSPG